MSTYRLTPAARGDLSRIWDYSEERWGLRQAEVYPRDLQACLECLADDPRRGRPRDEVRPGYRSRAVGSHVVLYVMSDGGVDVIRVLRQRMDPGRHV